MTTTLKTHREWPTDDRIFYRCLCCGHLPHFSPLHNCGAIDAAGDECDCQSYQLDLNRPVKEK
jgi:hypothetical protein